MNSKIFVIAAIVLGVIVVLMVNARFSDLETKANPPKETFFLAATDIMPGVTVAEALAGRGGQLKRIETIPQEFARAFPDALDSSELTWARDRIISRPVAAGDFLRVRDLDPPSGEELQSRIPPGHVALAIEAEAATGVGYLLAPGDTVDVYLVVLRNDPDSPGGIVAQSRKVGQDLDVFAVDDRFLQRDGTGSGIRGQAFSSVTLTGTPTEIEALLEARSLGKLNLVLKGPAASPAED